MKKKGGKLKWIIIVCVVLIVGGALARGSDKEASDTGTDATADRSVSSEKEEKEQTEEKEKDVSEVHDFTDGMSAYNTGEYLFITNEDLDKYSPNMEGVKVYVVTDIDDLKDGRIQSNLSDGYMMSSFYVGDNYDSYKEWFKDDDVVAILGTVSGYNNYKITGKSVEVQDCLVFAEGDDAEKYKKDVSDEGLSEYFVVTDAVANTNSDISEEEYKNLCEVLSYEDILRNPDSNKGKYVKVSGKVNQVIEGWFDTYTIYLNDGSGNTWECSYKYKDGESHVLEGDGITVYGKCNGTTTSTTVLGKQMTLPDVDVEYLEQ